MRLVACAVAGLVTLGAGAASAQPFWGPDRGRFYEPERAPLWERDRGWVGPMRPQQIAYIVESMGLDPVGPPRRHGNLLVQRATDDYGRVMQVTINTESGEVVSVAPAGAPPPVNGRPYEAYRPYGPGPYGRPAPDADDDVEFAPPGSIMAPRAALPPGADRPPGAIPQPGYPVPRAAAVTPYPPPVIEAPRPASKSATVTPAKPPVPRKRPEGAETAKKAEPGSVAPLPATPAPAPTPGTPPANAMPPVAPLE